ncbi:uncharacterized protein LOC144884949 [Branchiostoma floridae x Branchiostoma japonicum]
MIQYIQECNIFLLVFQCVDTHYVELFNNSLLQYHDKRIVFGNSQYTMRSHLAILDWNEHVDRDYTSIIRRQSAKNPRAVEGHKVLKPKTNSFKSTIWDRFMARIFPAGED